MAYTPVKVLVAQGGGPTVVINQSLVGIVLQAQEQWGASVYGARHGVRGILQEDFVDLTTVDRAHLEAVASTPAAALGSTRDKPDEAYCQKMLRVMQAHGITHFFYIGGNDSAETVRIVQNQATASGYPLACLHIPKTIDNDLVGTDHCPGYPSAARFVAQGFAGADLDNAALTGVYIGVVMGRHAGFLTAAAAAARVDADDGPHLIYVPERSFTLEQFAADVQAVYARLGRCVVAVSEGIADANGKPLMASLAAQNEHDAHGNLQLSGNGALADFLCQHIKSTLGINRVRGDTFGYLQRSFLGCYSDVDQAEARQVGIEGVRFAAAGHMQGSVAMQRNPHPDGGYAVRYVVLPLQAVASQTRTLAAHWINTQGNDITPAFLDYLLPLLGSNRPIKATLKAPAVARLLP
jgi:6-phosphofructokinase 1